MSQNIINALFTIACLALPLHAKEKGDNMSCTAMQSNGLPHLYFAYGSNLSYDFLKERLKNGEWIEGDGWHKSGVLEEPIPVDLGSFELPDYEFSYSLDVEPFGDTGTAGNVVPKKGERVYGVVYRLSEAHLAELDKTEDVPEAYARVAVKVHRCAIAILGEHSAPASLTAWVYVGNPKYVVQKENPDPLYVDLLVKSACDRSFPPKYIDQCLRVNSLEESQEEAM